MGNPQKDKGDKFERELADFMNSSLFPHAPVPQIFRTPLSGSFSLHDGVGSADLTGTPGLWVEAKRVETFRPHTAMAQAVRGSDAAGKVDKPVVITRRNKQTLPEALCMMRLADFTEIYRGYLLHLGYKVSPHPVAPEATADDPAQPSFGF